MFKREDKRLFVAVILSVLVIGFSLGTVYAQSFTTYLESGSLVKQADYTVFTDAGTVYALNGLTGRLEFSGTGTTVLTSVITALSSGGSIFIRGTVEVRFVNLTSNLEIFGSSPTESVLKLTAGDMGTTILYGVNIGNLSIHDLMFHGNYEALTGEADGTPFYPTLIKLTTTAHVNINRIELSYGAWFGIDAIGGGQYKISNIYSTGMRADPIALNNLDYVQVDGVYAQNWTDSGDQGASGLWINSRDVTANNIYVQSFPLGVRVEAFNNHVYRVALSNIIVKDGVRAGIDIARKNDVSFDVWGVSVTNFVISDFNIGIRLELENDGMTSQLHSIQISNGFISFLDGTFLADRECGIWMYNATSVAIANVRVIYADDEAVSILSSDKVKLTDVSGSNSNIGLNVINSDYLVVIGGLFDFNTDKGFYGDSDSEYAIVSNIRALSNSGTDISWTSMGAGSYLVNSYNGSVWVASEP